VQLPAHMGNSEEDGEVALLPAEGQRGRITVFTVCDAFEQATVIKAIQRKHASTTCSSCSEVVLVQGLPSYQPGLDKGDLFIFDYGVVVCWGLSAAQELSVLNTLRPCQVKPLRPEDVHKEELGFQYTSDQLPNIQNDVITISRLKALDQQVKLAISHALAQSSKLSVYETRVADLVELVRHLPESMMEHGEIKMPRKQMARLMGRVFIQKSEVNLLSSVLDTPEFFWRAPDALQALYGTVGEYLELEDRANLVNNRTVLIQSMLNMWSDHANHHHVARLDRIIIILIVVEVAIAFAQIVGFFNY